MSFEPIVTKLKTEIEALEQRTRTRSEEPSKAFTSAVRHFVVEAWKGYKSVPPQESSIHLGRSHYSHTTRYADKSLTYRQVKAAYNGLVGLGYIRRTHKGYYDPVKLQGKLTQYVATQKLIDLLDNLKGSPAIAIGTDLEAETILLRTKNEKRKLLVDYPDTPQTLKHRANLKEINACLSRHWLDLHVLDSEYDILAARITADTQKQPIDFSKRTLVRIFSDPSFKHGGRFYRGWWQNIPSEYRKYLTIDTKPTVELDYSQLNPNILYALAGKELGSVDAYDRVLNGNHRKLVKQAFNAMVQAKSGLKSKPETLDLSGTGLEWKDLRQAVLDAHQPISDYFFKGIGNKLQYEDSCIAETVMLHFVKSDIPVYPVHDSFIMHHGYEDELKEQMNVAFQTRFKSDIEITVEPVDWTYLKSEQKSQQPTVDEILNSQKPASLWHERNQQWFSRAKYKAD